MKPPRNSKEVSKFLGMSQWYAKFIKNYADLSEPLYNLKRKLKKFIWSNEAQKVFDVVKATVTKAPVLKLPDFKKAFELFTDASSIGLGTVLKQEQRPVVFASRTLSTAERNYTVTERERERECLAVVWALNKFRTYLGSLPIKVITDHAALTRLTHGKNLSNRMIRWALGLAEFNIEWEHRHETQNAVTDVWSRNPIESIIGEKVHCKIIRDLVLSTEDQLIEEQRTDPELGHIYRYLENPARLMRQYVESPFPHPLSSATRKVVAKFKPKFEGPYRVLDVENNNVVVWKAGKRVQRRSRESQDGKKKGSEVKRELEEKWLSFRSNQGEKHRNKTNKRRLLIRSIPSSWSEKSRRIKRSKKEMLGYKRSHESVSGGPERKIQKGSEHRVPKRTLSSNYKTNSNLPKFRKKSRREETVTPTTSGYNLRPRSGKRAESRPTLERKTQQGGPVLSRKGRGRNDSPYIEERTRSNKNARRGGEEQRQDQERSVHEKVFIPGGPGRKRQLQVIRTRLYRFFLYSIEQVVGRIIATKQVTVGYLKFKPSKSGHYNECVFLEEKN
ncbi:retrovirus-related Pol polyprotein from transposon opus [Trichonephila clavipes]|nr:retrovirus-related Pol polyprotein from transposon opus [Trichonephila clavipes]